MQWSPKLDETLAYLWDAVPQLSTKVIAERMALTKNAIVGRAHRLKLTPRPSPLKPKSIHTRVEKRRTRCERIKQVVVLPSFEQTVPEIPVPVVVVAPSHPGACLYPTTSRAPWRFCDAPTQSRKVSYCAFHRSIALVRAA